MDDAEVQWNGISEFQPLPLLLPGESMCSLTFGARVRGVELGQAKKKVPAVEAACERLSLAH